MKNKQIERNNMKCKRCNKKIKTAIEPGLIKNGNSKYKCKDEFYSQ